MNGLIVLGTTVVGGFIGGMVGLVGAMLYADMEVGSMDAVGYILGGASVFAAGGAYVGGELVAG